jgi:DNA-binding response OmpR family regulator
MVVLIIEPDSRHAASLDTIVRALAHEPIACRDPQTAIQRADQCNPSVILLGLSFQGLDVYQYVRLLRAQHDLARVKIVAVSGEVSDPRKARDAGIETELLRPYSRGIVPLLRETLQAEAHSR